ncbi:MAG: AGE family epimerase/isomerase [Spirochaetota bacterium]
MNSMFPGALDLASIWAARLPLGPEGFAEEVGPRWTDASPGRRTSLCQARLAYVFTHAGTLGYPGSAEARAAAKAGSQAILNLQRVFWKAEARGWSKASDGEGTATDCDIDSYDQAFGLLAMAWNFRASGDPDSREIALEALAGLDAAAGKAGIEGYPEWRNYDGSVPMAALAKRRQNPHMHLLEAFLAWNAFDPSGPWLERAASMVGLFREHFTATPQGSLAEYFDANLDPIAGPDGALREPGHHFEWIWLLRRWELASGDRAARGDADSLWEFAADKGIDSDGFAFDEVSSDGRIITASRLLWPQTELLKAHCARLEWKFGPTDRAAAARVAAGLGTYAVEGEKGLWHNRIGREGKAIGGPALSRLLYHLFVALCEFERIDPGSPYLANSIN